MWRYFAGGGAMLLLIVAGFFLWQGIAQRDETAPSRKRPSRPRPPTTMKARRAGRAAPAAIRRRAHA